MWPMAKAMGKRQRQRGQPRRGDILVSREVTTAMSPLFLAAIEATEEAVYNSMFKATTVTGNGHTVEALPIEKTMKILREHQAAK